MATYKHLRDVVAIAIKDGGVTINNKTHDIINSLDEWLFPRWPDITVAVPESRLEPALMEFVSKHADKIRDYDVYLGIWRKDNKYFIDLNAHASSIAEATTLAKSYAQASDRGIISAYNPAKDATHYF